MAGRGVNYGQDISMVPGTRCLTTTALHLVVCGGSVTTGWTPDIPNTAPATQTPIGIIQTPRLSAGSVDMAVRPAGISAALAAESVDAFHWLGVDAGTLSLPGYVTDLATQRSSAATAGANTLVTGIAVGVIGMSLEAATTLQKFEILVRPFVTYGTFE